MKNRSPHYNHHEEKKKFRFLEKKREDTREKREDTRPTQALHNAHVTPPNESWTSPVMSLQHKEGDRHVHANF